MFSLSVIFIEAGIKTNEISITKVKG